MIERITPYVGEGGKAPVMVGVLLEGEEFERPYVPKWQLVEAQMEAERLRDALHGRYGVDGELTAVDINGEVLD